MARRKRGLDLKGFPKGGWGLLDVSGSIERDGIGFVPFDKKLEYDSEKLDVSGQNKGTPGRGILGKQRGINRKARRGFGGCQP